MSKVSGMIAIPASLRSDFIHIPGTPIHIALESTIHITGIRIQAGMSASRQPIGQIASPGFRVPFQEALLSEPSEIAVERPKDRRSRTGLSRLQTSSGLKN